MGLGRDLRRARSLDHRTLADLATAVTELAFARIRLVVRNAESVIGTQVASVAAPATCERENDPTIDRVAFAIPRAAARVPWRATCLVQALAAQRWLARIGIASELKLGARKSEAAGLDAHAWLDAGGRTVIGGDSDAYQPFRPSRRD